MEPINKVLLIDPTKAAASLAEEFKAFAIKGNVVDLAVGVIIGSAFAKITDSLVKHILMPLISVVTPAEQGYLTWKWVVNGKSIPYGLFLGEIVNFLIIAIALFFFVVKFLGWIMRTKRTGPMLTRDQQILTEIRDLLKQTVEPKPGSSQ